MKRTFIEVKARPNYDLINIDLPNHTRIIVKTTELKNTIEISFVNNNNEDLLIKPMGGNQFILISQ